MNVKKLMLATAITASLTGIYGCSEGDDSSLTINSTSTGGGSSSTISVGCPSWTTAKPQDSVGNNVCALPSTIAEDRNLTSDLIWLMEGRVTVGNGNQQMSITEGTLESGDPVLDVTLTIQPGTEIKGATGTFANLVITRGSSIVANGSEDAPIIFSSDDDDYEGSGEWGGIVIHGYGLHNNADDSTCGGGTCQNVDAEGESGFAGGSDNSDSSGSLRYVVVTEGGYEFAPGNEINGISFVAVGSGTTVEYVQVDNNSDDGVEFYGGAVNAKYLVLTGNLDDSVDWDEAYQGNLQHVLVVQSPNTEGNAIEADTEGSATPLSIPTIANATFIGDGEKDTLLVFKAESGGFLHYSVLTSNVADPSTITCEDTSDATDTVDALVLAANVIADCTPDTTGEGTISITGVADVALNSTYASQDGSASGLTAFDTYIAAFNAGNGVSVADEDFFDATTYAGAVDPAATETWWDAWALDGSVPAR